MLAAEAAVHLVELEFLDRLLWHLGRLLRPTTGSTGLWPSTMTPLCWLRAQHTQVSSSAGRTPSARPIHRRREVTPRRLLPDRRPDQPLAVAPGAGAALGDVRRARAAAARSSRARTSPPRTSADHHRVVARAVDEVLGAVDRVDGEGVVGRAEPRPAARRRRAWPPRRGPARPGRPRDSASVISTSASRSATVTRSPGFFSSIWSSSSDRNRGLMTSSATSCSRVSTSSVSTRPP